MKSIAALVAVVAVAVVGSAATAVSGASVSAVAAGTIVYVCAAPAPTSLGLCSIRADGSGRRLLTPAAGAEAAYASPSLSSDGRRLAFVADGQAYAADASALHRRRLGAADGVALEPSGRRVLLLRRVELCNEPRERCKRTGLTGRIVNWSGGPARARRSFLQSADWLTPTRLIGPDAIDPSRLLSLPTSGCCGRLLLRSERWHFRDPAVSPDGETIAVSAVQVDGPGVSIALISRDGKQLRLLSEDANAARYEDFSPSWSPDGKWIVFMRRRPNGELPGTLMVLPTRPGATPRSLGVRGYSPTWGT